MTATTKLSAADLNKNARLINVELKAIIEATETSAQHAITAGHILKACKDSVGHGEWEKWLGQNCPDISMRTASYYMRLAKHEQEIEEKFKADGNRQRIADLSASALHSLIPAKPKTPEQLAKAEKAKAEKDAKAATTAKANASASIETLLEALAPDELVTAVRHVWGAEQIEELVKQLGDFLSYLNKSKAEDGLGIPPELFRRQFSQPTT
jgi:Protein of unknown function (DUF3102)